MNPTSLNPTDMTTMLTRLNHPVVVEATKPIDPRLPPRQTLWPVELEDPVEQIAEMAESYNRVFVTLNTLRDEVLRGVPPRNVGPRLSMFARRSHLLVDVDAHGTSLDEAERQKDRIKEYLGWPMLIETYSGNGFGLIYEIDLPCDDGKRVQRFLEGLKSDFPCVDTSVHTLNRYTRLAGTFNVRNGERVLTRILN